tara:strand:+ start:110 stop:373 length:264 start_codon:yes stop_codon:yes gene_type:complete
MIKVITLHQSTITSPEAFMEELKRYNDLVTEVSTYSNDEDGMIDFIITVNERLYSRYNLTRKTIAISVVWKLGHFTVNLNELRDFQE